MNPESYRTIRPSDDFLEKVQLSIMVYMDEFGNDAMDMMRTEMVGPVGEAMSTLRDNFPCNNLIIFWSKKAIEEEFQQVAEMLAQEKANDSGEGVPPVSAITRQLLIRLLQRKTNTEFAIRRFNHMFWIEALEPIFTEILRLPPYYTEAQQNAMKERFAALFAAEISAWISSGFDSTTLGTVNKNLEAAVNYCFQNYHM